MSGGKLILKEVTASQGGITSIANQSGLGVRVADIRRSFDALLTSRKLSASANFEQSDGFLRQVEKLEDLLTYRVMLTLGPKLEIFFVL